MTGEQGETELSNAPEPPLHCKDTMPGSGAVKHACYHLNQKQCSHLFAD